MDKGIKDAYNKALEYTIESHTTLKPDPGMWNLSPRPPHNAPKDFNDTKIEVLNGMISTLKEQLQEKEKAIKELQLALKQILEVKGGQAT